MVQAMLTRDRAFAGCIVTLINRDTGEQKVCHAAGYHYTQQGAELHKRPNSRRDSTAHRIIHTQNVMQSLARLMREVSRWEGDWKVRTISTPQTVLADLKGRKSGGKKGTDMPNPEAMFLSKIGRSDMWEKA